MGAGSLTQGMFGQAVRIFISSPVDVRQERLLAGRVVQRLAREFADHFAVEPVLWEREPLVAQRHFQDSGNIPLASACDIVVVILWSRLGVFLPAAQFRGAVSGRAPVTGTEWEFEEALSASRAAGKPDLLFYRKTAPPRQVIDFSDAEAVRAQLEQWRMVQDFFGRWFDGGGGGLAHHLFADEAAFEDILETHLRARLRQFLAGRGAGPLAAPAIRWHRGSPFRGLGRFEAEHAPVFFGRARPRAELRARLRRRAEAGCAFVCVVGASGAGKSSLVRAGLVPDLLLPGMLSNVALCRVAIARPADCRGAPLRALADAIVAGLPELSDLKTDAAGLAALLATAPAQAGFAIGQALQAARQATVPPLASIAEARLILLVDQLEEIFTDTALDRPPREVFAAALESLACAGPVWVIATLRSDFADRLEAVPTLARLCDGDARHLLLPPDRIELGQIIRGPAREAGLRFETDEETGQGLDDILLEAAAGRSGTLPLLEFSLEQLFIGRAEEAGTNGVLTLAAYRDLGGLEGAIGRRADEVLETLDPEVQAALPAVLRALVTVAPGTRGAAAARTAPLAAFPAGSARRALVDAFQAENARLLVTDETGATVRVVHEALLTHWPAARALIAAERQDLQLRARLELAEGRWREADEADRPSLLLPAGLPLSEATDFAARRQDDLEPALAAYIALSAAAQAAAQARRLEEERRLIEGEQAAERERLLREAEMQRLQAAASGRLARRTRVAAGGLLVLLVAALGLGMVARQEGRRAEQARRHAERSEAAARQAVDGLVTTLAGSAHVAVGMPIGLVEKLLDQAAAVIASMRAADPDNAALQAEQSQALSQFAFAYRSAGDTGRAIDSLQKAIAIDRLLVGRTDIPDQQRVEQRGQLVRHLALAAQYSVNVSQFDRAEPFVREALAVAGANLTARPQDDAARALLGIARRQAGLLALVRHDYRGAIAILAPAVQMQTALAAGHPTDIPIIQTLSGMEEALGDSLWNAGDLKGAVAAYEVEQQMAGRAAGLLPDSIMAQNNLASSYERLGDARGALGDMPGALASYRGGLAITEKLSRADTSNLKELYDASSMRDAVAQAEFDAGQLDGARADFGQVVAAREASTRADPTNLSWKSGLVEAQIQLGEVALTQHDLDAAVATFREAVDGSSKVAATAAGKAGLAGYDLTAAAWLAGAREERAYTPEALRAFAAAVDRLDDYVRNDPDNTEQADEDLALSIRAAQALAAHGDLGGAKRLQARIATIETKLRKADLLDPTTRRVIAEADAFRLQ